MIPPLPAEFRSHAHSRAAESSALAAMAPHCTGRRRSATLSRSAAYSWFFSVLSVLSVVEFVYLGYPWCVFGFSLLPA